MNGKKHSGKSVPSVKKFSKKFRLLGNVYRNRKRLGNVTYSVLYLAAEYLKRTGNKI